MQSSPDRKEETFRLNQLAYLDELRKFRPDLSENLASCYQALVLKVELRKRLLTGTETPAQLEEAESRLGEKAPDLDQVLEWMKSHRTASASLGARYLLDLTTNGVDVSGLSASQPSSSQFQRAIQGFPWGPAAYSPEVYIGYRVGPSGPVGDDRGIDYKVFIDFADPVRTLTPEVYQEYIQKLAEAGFRGDSKIPSDPHRPEQIRFQYNVMIVHSNSREDAIKAEQVTTAFFGKSIIHVSRGVDVLGRSNTKTNIVGMRHRADWHHLLCMGRYSMLPDDLKDFVSGL